MPIAYTIKLLYTQLLLILFATNPIQTNMQIANWPNCCFRVFNRPTESESWMKNKCVLYVNVIMFESWSELTCSISWTKFHTSHFKWSQFSIAVPAEHMIIYICNWFFVSFVFEINSIPLINGLANDWNRFRSFYFISFHSCGVGWRFFNVFRNWWSRMRRDGIIN